MNNKKTTIPKFPRDQAESQSMNHPSVTNDNLTNSLYAELYKIARSRRRGYEFAQTLQTTEVVNEAWLRLKKQEWQDRGHFLGAAARVMKCVVIDRARRRSAAKRNGTLPCDDYVPNREDEIAVQNALEKLADAHPVAAEVVQMRFYSGYTMKAISDKLGLSPSTIDKKWAFARAWLSRELART